MNRLYKIFEENISKTAVDFMFYGLGLSFGLLIIGVFSYNLNIALWQESYINSIFSIKIITSAMSLFVQSFFFALLFDCVRMSSK